MSGRRLVSRRIFPTRCLKIPFGFSPVPRFGIGQTQNENCASKVNVERGASGFNRAGTAESDGSRGRNRAVIGAARVARTVARSPENTLDLAHGQIPTRVRPVESVAGFEHAFQMRTSKFLNRVPGAVKGRKCGCFSAGRANNRAWRRRAPREENPKPDANASSRRQVSRRKGIVQKTHLCGGACAASGGCCPEVAMA